MISASPAPNQPLRYFLYARKSTDDASRQIRSIGDQIAEVREMATRDNLSILDEFIEKQSAKKPGRPVFNAMLDRIDRGEAQGIIAWNPDRLSRNWSDGGRIIHLLDTGALLDLKFPTYKFDLSANGKFLLGISLSQSKYYSDNLSENITRGKRQKIKNGLWPQVAPLGYVNDKQTRLIEPHPVHAPLVKQMFELYATGDYGLKELREHLVAIGLRGLHGAPPSVSKIQLALSNPIYYGVMRYMGEYYDGKHTPIISKALFERCREVMQSRGRVTRYRYKPFVFRGLVRCGRCGCLTTLEQQGRYRYVRCSRKRGRCGDPYVREEELTRQVGDALRMAAISETFAAELHGLLDQEAARQKDAVALERQRLEAAIAQCDARIHRLLEMSVDGAISIEEYREAKNTLVLDRRQKAESLGKLAGGVTEWFEIRRTLTNASLEATSVIARGDAAEMVRYLKIVGLKWTLRDRRLQWVPREPWQLIVGQDLVQMGGTGEGSDQAGVGAPDREERIKRREIPDSSSGLSEGFGRAVGVPRWR